MDKVRIRLGSPAKIGGKVHPVGAEIEVDPPLAAELAAFGLVEAAPAAPARDEPPKDTPQGAKTTRRGAAQSMG